MAGGQASGNCISHIKHLNRLFQALHQEVMHPGEPEQEVGVPGGQEDRLWVIVHTTFMIIRDFLRLYIKRWCTQKNGAGGGSTWRAREQASGNCTYHIRHLYRLFQALHQEVVHPGEPEHEVGVPAWSARGETLDNFTYHS